MNIDGESLVVLGIDLGRKRVGLAIYVPPSAPKPVMVVKRAKGEAEATILALIDQHHIATVVCGLPLNANGQETEACLDVKRFCRRLQRRRNVKIVYQDEYLTTQAAKDLLVSGGRVVNSDNLDSEAAKIILDDFLAVLVTAEGDRQGKIR